jgi:ribosomal protein S21
MAIIVKRKENEPLASFLYRVNKRIQKSGILIEARKKAHASKKLHKNKIKEKAYYRLKMQQEMEKFLKLGYSLEESIDLARKKIKGIIKK